MKSILHLVILCVYLILANSDTDYNDYTGLRRSLISYIRQVQARKRLKTAEDNSENSENNASEDQNDKEDGVQDKKDIKNARQKALVLSKAKGKEVELNQLPYQTGTDMDIGKVRYHMDPVFNVLRTGNLRRLGSDGSSPSVSSSREFGDFKEQFRDLWLQKKYEALNSTLPGGDEVNMVAARPWGVKCGDPRQHDMPWGTCMLSSECEPEYRIYRGDIYCGRTSFVCCALEATTYDMYQGFDVSFEDKGLSTDTEEMKHRDTDEVAKKGNKKDKKNRKGARVRRKKKIKRTIKKIINEIQKILDTIYRNASKQKKTRSKQMRKLIQRLKKEYKQNRLAVKDLHEENMIKIDAELMKKILQLKALNHNFMNNATFASIVVNGTMSKEGARMLIQAYPDLATFLTESRRTSDGKNTPDYLDYDVEYGFLYF